MVFNKRYGARLVLSLVALGCVFAPITAGQTTIYNFHQTYRIGFDQPEGWGLKYFTSASLLSAVPLPAPSEQRRPGSITVGFELGWLPSLSAGQQRIGFNGTTPEDLNKAPIFARPVIRIGLPWKLTAIAAAPPPFELFGVKSRLLAFGLERPIVEREQWALSLRGDGQVGSVKGAFTCPKAVLAFAPGPPDNPTECVGESADVATLRYAGIEAQFAHRLARMPRLLPHVGVGAHFIDGIFQVHAPVTSGLDETRLWTRGAIASMNGGVTYSVTKRAKVTLTAFYSPLWVRRSADAPRTNDGLFNFRAFLSYTLR